MARLLAALLFVLLASPADAQIALSRRVDTAPRCRILGPAEAWSGAMTTTTAAQTIVGVADDLTSPVAPDWTCPECTVTSGTATGTTAWSFAVTLQSGANVISVTPKDGDGNSGTPCTATLTLSGGDVTPPTLNITTPAVDPFVDDATPVTMIGTASDASGIDTVTASVFSGTNCSPGTVTGTTSWSVPITFSLPGTSTTCVIEIEACDTVGLCTQAQHELTYTGGPLTIATTSIPDAAQGQPYTAILTATGGIPPYTWTESGSALGSGACTGLSLSDMGDDGQITGTPPTLGTCAPTAQVEDNEATTDTEAYSFDVEVETDGNAYFENLILDAGVIGYNSFRTEALIDQGTVAASTNPYFDVDPTHDMACGYIPAGAKSWPNDYDLGWNHNDNNQEARYNDYPRDGESFYWVMDYRHEEEIRTTFMQYPDWDRSKNIAILENDPLVTGTTWFKYEINYKQNEASPVVNTRWSICGIDGQFKDPPTSRGNFGGTNITQAEPCSPHNNSTNFEEFDKIYRVVFWWTAVGDGNTQDNFDSTLDVWRIGEGEAPIKLWDGINFRSPWNASNGFSFSGFRVQMLNPKSISKFYPWTHVDTQTTCVRNFVFGKDPVGGINTLLEAPIP